MVFGRFRNAIILSIVGFGWIAAAGFGIAALMSYDNRPGAAADAPVEWPRDSIIVRDPARPTLVMLAHPKCDCTNASLSELAELLARTTESPRAFVLFIKPRGVEDHWEQTSLWQRAEAIPGVTVVKDERGTEASRFGSVTSGQILLYDASGHLMFSGGTTGGRGKRGDNAGRATLLALLSGEHPANRTTPVFGCSLFGPGEEAGTAHQHES
jgi:hypothetical protein